LDHIDNLDNGLAITQGQYAGAGEDLRIAFLNQRVQAEPDDYLCLEK